MQLINDNKSADSIGEYKDKALKTTELRKKSK